MMHPQESQQIAEKKKHEQPVVCGNTVINIFN